MFQEHPSFKGPENPNVKIWRYMDLPKFLSLLDTESLYFTRADKLGDPFEGSFTQQNRVDFDDEQFQGFLRIYKNFRKSTLVNCWHVNEHESEAMWKLYSKSNAGIAIQSTYCKFLESLSKDKFFGKYIGLINYIDYNIDRIDLMNAFNSFVCKRKSFEHERELRAVICLDVHNPGITYTKTEIGQLIPTSDIRVEHGINIPIDIHKLIEKIYVAPDCELWCFELIQNLVKRHNLNFEVTRSSLDDMPLY